MVILAQNSIRVVQTAHSEGDNGDNEDAHLRVSHHKSTTNSIYWFWYYNYGSYIMEIIMKMDTP